METASRKYYEYKLREFNQYRRGRSLQQAKIVIAWPKPSVANGLELVVEGYQWIISKRKELIQQLKAGAVSKVEFDRDMAEIRLLDQQLKAFSEQLEASKRRTKKVLEKDENKGENNGQ